MSEAAPTVSVLMPTYNQAVYLHRALASLLAQDFADWELVIVDDGSTDDTPAIVDALGDERIRSFRLDENVGLGAALNVAIAHASGRYVAYLPSDDAYDRHHLASVVAVLDDRPEVGAAYGGARWFPDEGDASARNMVEVPTLQGERAVGHEHEALRSDEFNDFLERAAGPSANLLAMVQVAHRRSLGEDVRWLERDERVTNQIGGEYWRALQDAGATFAYAGSVSATWTDHPLQHHKLTGGVHYTFTGGRLWFGCGLSKYRQHYGIPDGVYLNWQPEGPNAFPVDERARYAGVAPPARGARGARPARSGPGEGLRVLVVGDLGYNPDRLVALEQRGVELFGLWQQAPQAWNTAHSVPCSSIRTIARGGHWDRIRDLEPDLVYGLLNWQSIEVVDEVQRNLPGYPVVFHFKESPHIAIRSELWPALRRVIDRSAGLVLIDDEMRQWFEWALGRRLVDRDTLVLDGDLPLGEWFRDLPGEEDAVVAGGQGRPLPTVSIGNPIGVPEVEDLVAADLEVHIYAAPFSTSWRHDWLARGVEAGVLHVHDSVEPARWSAVLGRYAGAWLHSVRSRNGGRIESATFEDINLPARLGTYAAAGLPWIMPRNPGHVSSVARIAEERGIGLFHDGAHDLAAQLRDVGHVRSLKAAAAATRADFCFDTHADRLLAFFRSRLAS